MARPIQFGLFQPQIGLPFPLLKERALACEEYGFHSIWFTCLLYTSPSPRDS